MPESPSGQKLAGLFRKAGGAGSPQSVGSTATPSSLGTSAGSSSPHFFPDATGNSRSPDLAGGRGGGGKGNDTQLPAAKSPRQRPSQGGSLPSTGVRTGGGFGGLRLTVISRAAARYHGGDTQLPGPDETMQKQKINQRASAKGRQELEHFLGVVANNHAHKRTHRKAAVPNATVARVERCTRCTKDEMWNVYDVFRSMDRQKCHRIDRQDFICALQEFPTLDRLRVLRKANFEHRFRTNPESVSLEEFLLLIWPGSTNEDLQKMLRWAQLRDAQAVLREKNFRGEVSELKKIFELLDENGDQMLTLGELTRARIFSRAEIVGLMQNHMAEGLNAKLTFGDFVSTAQTQLKEMYVSQETKKAIEEEQNSMQLSFRNMLND